MKNLITFKSIIVLGAFAIAMMSDADTIRDNKVTLTQVRAVDDSTSELSFTRSYRTESGKVVKQSIRAIDDDGLLAIATLNFNLSQVVSEHLFQTAEDARSRLAPNTDPNYVAMVARNAANKEWEIQKNRRIISYLTVRPALLSALNKLAVYSSKLIEKKTLELRASRNPYEIDRLRNEIEAAKLENEEARRVYDVILSAEKELTPKELSDSVGKLLQMHGKDHYYATSIDGEKGLALSLFDRDLANPLQELDLHSEINNPLGALFRGRQPQINDYVVFQDEARGTLEFGANVLQEIESSSRATTPEVTHRQASSIDSVLE